MFLWIFDYPTWEMGALFGLGFMVLSLAGMFLVRPIFHKWIHGQDRTNEMVSLNIASFSVFYGIMLGLVAVGVYANYSAIGDLVEREASTVAALYSDTSALPEPHRTQLLTDLRAYAEETIKKDWPTMAKGIVPQGGTLRIRQFQNDLLAVHPTVKMDEIAYAEASAQYEKLVELRSNRLVKVRSGIPSLLWSVVVLGAIFSMAIICMLDMQVNVHAILTAVLSVFLGIVIFLVAEMDRPFRGNVLTTAEAYQLVFDGLMNQR